MNTHPSIEGVVPIPGSVSDIKSDIFYVEHRAPYRMNNPHVHGHIELNYLTDCSATYQWNGQQLAVPKNRLMIFWANIPHQMIDIQGDGLLYNLYVPLPSFLQWSLNDDWRQAIMTGQMIMAPEDHDYLQVRLQRWHRDFTDGSSECRSIILGELALLLKRISLESWQTSAETLLSAKTQPPPPHNAALKGAHHVSAMIRFIGEHLDQPLQTADVAAHRGLHKNYAGTLFSRVMGISIKQYVQFQRLQQAQRLLLESDNSIEMISELCGFNSLSRFYEAFQRYFGMSPGLFRRQLVQRKLSKHAGASYQRLIQ